MSGPFTSIVNFTVNDFLQRAKKLSYLHSMKCQSIISVDGKCASGFSFPRHHKHKTIDVRQSSTLFSASDISINTIEHAVMQAYSYANRMANDLNINVERRMSSLEKMSKLAVLQLRKSQIVDYSHLDEHDTDFDSDSDESDTEDTDHDDNYSDCDDVSVIEEDLEDDLSRQFFKISPATFQGMRVFDSINPSLAQSYFVIATDNKKKYLHKQTAAWILLNEKYTLSSDRLKRVMTNK